MSKSRRKNKIFSNASGSDKYNKRKSNRKMRRLLKEKNYEITPNIKDFSNVYYFKKDGKHYFKDASGRDMLK